MKRILLLFLFCIHISLNAQILTIEKIESKWNTLYQKGSIAFGNHDYFNAHKYLEESIGLLESNDARNTRFYIYSLIKMGEIYDKTREQEKELAVTNELINIRHSIRPNTRKEVDYLYNIGYYLSNLRRYNEALTFLNEANSLDVPLAQMRGEKSRVLHRIAFCNYCLGNLEQAIVSETECIMVDDNSVPDYRIALAFYYYKSGDWSRLDDITSRCFFCARERVLRKFSQSNANDRAHYWDKTKYYFTDYLPLFAIEHQSDTMASYAYDAALFSKGILLAAENKSTELTLNSNDPKLIKQYGHYLDLKKKKNRTIDEEFEMEALADVFIRFQKEHKKEYRQDFRISWRDIQSKLKEDDIAIEFITVQTENVDIEYYALSIKKNSRIPKLTRIAGLSEIEAIPREHFYTTPRLYNLIWGKLEEELEGIQDVYFSAAGFIYNTAIEYLPDEDGVDFYQKKKVYRLSSTKELVLSKKKSIKKSALFGGINYDMEPSIMIEQGRAFDTTGSTHFPIPVDSTGLRGSDISIGFSYLKGSMEEIKNISAIEMGAGIEVELFSGNEGSEANFKRLSGKDVNALHIATHGFYYANKNPGQCKNIDQLFYESNTFFSPNELDIVDEDKLLTRSGLVLAGANNIVKEVFLPKEIQDGILYADEIAKMNLSEVDLLVLSACQSGLGTVVFSEGVFGLQRGFKKAGVNSIVMSLWRVNDDATRILMTEMYKNLATGQSKGEALSNAQNTLRSIEGGIFDKPEYWAAFVLIDALN